MSVPIIVCGAAGRMGRTLVQLVRQHPDATLHAAVEAADHPLLGRDVGEVAGLGNVGVRVTDDYARAVADDTVTLDFTTPAATLDHLRVSVAKGAAIVIGTTGYSEAEQQELDRLAAQTRAVVASNMSVGVNVLLKLVATAARILGADFDPEIVEIHHRLKVDAPSGTARELANRLSNIQEAKLEVPLDKTDGLIESRGARLQGTQVHSIRLPGYTISIDAIFGMPDQRLILRHESGSSAEPYVSGALLAIREVGELVGLHRGLDSVMKF